MKQCGGSKKHIIVARMKCLHCNSIHTILPDILVPYKHYASPVIEDVIDDQLSSEDRAAEDYSCELTIKRWKTWFSKGVKQQAEGMIRSAGHRLLGLPDAVLTIQGSLLDELRKDGAGWLQSVVRLIINTGNHIFTVFGINGLPPALFCVPKPPAVSSVP